MLIQYKAYSRIYEAGDVHGAHVGILATNSEPQEATFPGGRSLLVGGPPKFGPDNAYLSGKSYALNCHGWLFNRSWRNFALQHFELTVQVVTCGTIGGTFPICSG